MNVYVIPYADALDDSVNSQILEVISNYFLDLGRIDRIPKLDIIRNLSTIKDIHSVDVQFVAKKNEDYHKSAITDAQNKLNKYNFDALMLEKFIISDFFSYFRNVRLI